MLYREITYAYCESKRKSRMGEERWVVKVLGRETGGKETTGVDGWRILGWISRRWDVGIWTGLGWPRIETGGGRL